MMKIAAALGLAAFLAAACGACPQRPPSFHSVTLVPIGAVPELDGSVIAGLSRRFAGLRFEVAAAQPLTDAMLGQHRPQAFDIAVVEAMAPLGPGTIAVLARDLTHTEMNFIFAHVELERGLGVVSVARFRTALGDPREMTDAPSGEVLQRSRRRLEIQLTGSVAKLIGLGMRCDNARCVLRYPNDLTAFDAKGPDFCPEHAEKLRKLLAARR